jgi:hypothetical protein
MKKTTILGGCLAALLICLGACNLPLKGYDASALPPLSAETSSAAQPTHDHPAIEWMDRMQSMIPSLFCKDKSYFRECFAVSQQECEQETIRVTRICLKSKEDELKTAFKNSATREVAEKWGGLIGECVGTAYEFSFKDKRSNNSKCSDANIWQSS